jgi:MmyB-like transcription regulator ligand binding domain
LLEGVSPALLEPPANVLRISLHPDGMAPRIVNLGEWRGHLLQRLRRQIALSGAPELVALADEAQDWPAGEEPGELPTQELLAPLRLHTNAGELAFFSTITTFGTAVEITASEISIESFYPADRASAAALTSPASP